MPNFHETHPGSHTPDSAVADAMTWLGRTPSGMVNVALITISDHLWREQERTLYDELYRVLCPNHGSLFVWGSAAGLLGAGLSAQLIYSDLTHAWAAWDRPALNPDVALPGFGSLSREMPPSIVEYAIRAAAGPGRLCLDIFPRAPHVAQGIAQQIGARVLSVAPVSDLYVSDHTSLPPWVHDRAFADWFFKSLKKQGNCLVYPSQPHSSGYARLRIGGVQWYAHQVSWMLTHKRVIPQGIPLLHASCPDRRCCTPTHLRLGTTSVNLDERWLGRRREA